MLHILCSMGFFLSVSRFDSLYCWDKKTAMQDCMNGFLPSLVPTVGLEPTRSCLQQILSLSRLPIPTCRRQHIYFNIFSDACQVFFLQRLVLLGDFETSPARSRRIRRKKQEIDDDRRSGNNLYDWIFLVSCLLPLASGRVKNSPLSVLVDSFIFWELFRI